MEREKTEQLIKKIESIEGLACQSIEVLWGHSCPERAKLFFHYPTREVRREIQMLTEIDPSLKSPIRFSEQIVFQGGYFIPEELKDPLEDYGRLKASVAKINSEYETEASRTHSPREI